MTENEDTKWVAMPPLQGKVYAEMVMEVLRENEIPCYLQSLFGSGGLGVISGAGLAWAKDKIMVPEDKYEQAMEILESMVDHL
jgi:hypothetical protein